MVPYMPVPLHAAVILNTFAYVSCCIFRYWDLLHEGQILFNLVEVVSLRSTRLAIGKWCEQILPHRVPSRTQTVPIEGLLKGEACLTSPLAYTFPHFCVTRIPEEGDYECVVPAVSSSVSKAWITFP